MTKNYHELHREIIGILRRDYAGSGELGNNFDPRYYTQAIGQAWHDEKLDDLQFLRFINQMLACIGDRHLKLSLRQDSHYSPWSPGFFTRRYEDALYVTAVTNAAALHIGDRITAINNGTPGDHRANIQKNFFFSESPEREDWNGLLKMAESITVTDQTGTSLQLPIEHHPLAAPPSPPLIKELPDGVLYLRPGDFDGSGSAARFAGSHAAAIRACGGLILDMRNGRGNTDEDFYPLLPLVCREDTPLSRLLDCDYYINYSRLNCILKAAGLEGVVGSDTYIQELVSKAGSGFLLEHDAPQELIPAHAPAKVVVLTDTWCTDSGEAFLQAAKRAGAYCLGRPTLGTLDYGGEVNYALDDRFVFTWPTAVTPNARSGNGLMNTGIQPDEYVPWTPEECRTDLLLQAAQKHISQSK